MTETAGRGVSIDRAFNDVAKTIEIVSLRMSVGERRALMELVQRFALAALATEGK